MSAETWLPGPDNHEHQFVEEQEPTGRLMIGESTVIDQPEVAWVSEWLTLILDGASLADIAKSGEGRDRG